MRPSKTPPGWTCSSAECLPVRRDDLDLRGGRPERADHHRAVLGVRAEVGVRVRVLAGDQSVGVAHVSFTYPTPRSRSRQDPGHRDRDPVGPVVELVAQLVYGLLELEDRQQLRRWPAGPAAAGTASTRAW